ncbi:universal stress protein [Candidatus Bathyarchaeota archaeon]|nr:MAG: universal stress protein [Candidatus Bathyarchaeota archaeon]
MQGIRTIESCVESRLMRNLLAAVDQSHWAYAVIRRAVELTRLLNSELTILSVVNSNPMMKSSITDEAEKLTDFHRELVFKHFPANAVKMESNPGQGTVYRCGPGGELRIQSRIENGDPVDRICRCAEEIGADLVIVGSRGLGNVGTLVLGSVSEKVVRKSTRSVMVVKDAALDNSDWEKIGTSQRAGQRYR